jgi:hypothetical protein
VLFVHVSPFGLPVSGDNNLTKSLQMIQFQEIAQKLRCSMSKKLQVGDRAPNGTAVAVNGDLINLETLWSEGSTLLTFLRHFG